MKLCLFAAFTPNGHLLNYRKLYLQELKKCADKILLITAGALTGADLDFLAEHDIQFITRANKGHDFGSWYDGLKAIGNLLPYSMVMFANDSCIPLKPFDELAKWMDTAPYDYVGVTSNNDGSIHLQSYFVGFRPRTYPTLVSHFNHYKYLEDKRVIVRKYEIGLSRHLRADGCTLGARYPYGYSSVMIDPSIMSIPMLMKKGCPMIKKKIVPIFAKYLHKWTDFDVEWLLEGVTKVNRPGFDEDWYMQQHPNLQPLIDRRLLSCGFEHYMRLSPEQKVHVMPNAEGEVFVCKITPI